MGIGTYIEEALPRSETRASIAARASACKPAGGAGFALPRTFAVPCRRTLVMSRRTSALPARWGRAAMLLQVLLLSGCDDRVEQCNRLVDALNPHTETVSRAVESLASLEKDTKAPDRLAAAVDTADGALAPLALDDPKLAGWLLAYRRQLQSAKKAAQAVATAARSGDPAALHDAVLAADRVVATQDELLAEINAYCSAPPD
jgi:hypothetical protein